MTVEKILQAHNLKNTACRKYILAELLNSDTALSENEMKENSSDLFDRVTFYRTLKTLEEREAIHRVVLHDNTVKYAISKHHHDEDDTHAHFHCGKCDGVVCLGGKTKLEVELPCDYIKQEVFVVIEGICASCV